MRTASLLAVASFTFLFNQPAYAAVCQGFPAPCPGAVAAGTGSACGTTTCLECGGNEGGDAFCSSHACDETGDGWVCCANNVEAASAYGNSCASSAGCCLGYCVKGLCADPLGVINALAKAVGAACAKPADCVTGNCIGGFCTVPNGNYGCHNAGQCSDNVATCSIPAHEVTGSCCVPNGPANNCRELACIVGSDCCSGNCVNGSCLANKGDACLCDAQCKSHDCDGRVCNDDVAGGTGSACSDGNDCSAELSCVTNSCCINIGSILNRCTRNSDCCLLDGTKPVLCKDSVCTNDLNGACNNVGFCGACDNDSDCSPGNVCNGTQCKVMLGASQCHANSDCESNDCNVSTENCSCQPNGTTNVTSNANCCSWNDVGGTCQASKVGGLCTAGCSPGEACNTAGNCCIPYTSREKCSVDGDCCDGECEGLTCCSLTNQAPCTHNADCCQGRICDTDATNPICVIVANNGPCSVNADCLRGLTCNTTTQLCQ